MARGHDEAVKAALESEMLGADLLAGGAEATRVAIGTPSKLRKIFRQYEEAGVDQIIFVQQSGQIQHEHIMESLELLGREVLPEFLDRDEKLRAEKAKRLEPAIEAAMVRRGNPPPRTSEDHVVNAYPRRELTAAGKGDQLLELASNSATGE